MDAVSRGEQLKRDGVVIQTYDLRKTYVMGDQEIHAVDVSENQIAWPDRYLSNFDGAAEVGHLHADA